jgi:hypothetical protein
MGNCTISDNIIIQRVVERLAAHLPPGWRVGEGPSRARQIDAVLKISGPATNAGCVLVEAKTRLEPRDVDYLSAMVRPTLDQHVLIIAPFLSPRTQARLTAGGFGYADLTGNVRLSCRTMCGSDREQQTILLDT